MLVFPEQQEDTSVLSAKPEDLSVFPEQLEDTSVLSAQQEDLSVFPEQQEDTSALSAQQVDVFVFPELQEDVSVLSAQQDPVSPPQVHLSMSLPLMAALIIAQAHPTPLCTSIAWTGQLRAQAPHSMHRVLWTSTAVFSPSIKTPWGQTWLHRRQLMHRSG